MAEYEQTQQVHAPAEEVFAWLADIAHLPDYLPPVQAATLEGPSEGDNPGQKLRTTLQRPGDEQHSFDAEGYVSVDESARRMEWGAESGRDYSGYLTVADSNGGSEVTVHLSLGERSAEADLPTQQEGQNPVQEGISATLESIRRQIEEGSGKVATPPPPEGAELSLEDNPAVVDER
ncbi:MAG: SRPBCC family protein [Janthinobacterium lividum]